MNYLDLVSPDENANEVPDQYFFDRLRIWRDRELAQSDWTQLADSTANKTAYATYALMIADKIDMASGVPMLTMIIGYSIGNGVNARQGTETSNVFGAKTKK